MINPGVFGLMVLDSFIAQLPLITTEFKNGAPESAYLEPEVNCLVVKDSLESFAAAVIHYLQDETLQARLKAGCHAGAQEYTVDNMIERFCTGILQALAKH
jgi:glycosyltransferase involved in cell wall biosynthesis